MHLPLLPRLTLTPILLIPKKAQATSENESPKMGLEGDKAPSVKAK